MRERDEGFWERLRPWRTRAEIRSDVDEEIAFHLDMRTEELMGEGMDVDEARREALREFGDVERGRRDMERGDIRLRRRRRAAVWMEDVRQDVGFALRTLRKRPRFAAVIVLTLALGLGAATAMFSVVDGVLLKPLPVEDEGRVVVVWEHDRARDFPHMPLSYAAVGDLRQAARSLDGVGAVPSDGLSEWTMDRDGAPVQVGAAVVTGDFFSVLGLRPEVGRLLRPGDDVTGAGRVMVLSHAAWRRHFASDPEVVGRSVRLSVDGGAYTIVGVAPAGFDYPRGVDVWTPVVPLYSQEGQGPGGQGPRALERGGVPFLDVVARLAPGATLEGARREIDAVLAEHPERHGAEDEVVVRTLPEVLVGDVRPALLILFAAVGVLLLIACVNVAGLLLIRGLGRRRELAVRAALGAGRARTIRQLTTESILLGLAGWLLALIFAYGALDAVMALTPAELPRADEVGLDVRAVGFALVLALAASLLFGLFPALSTTGGESAASLRAGGRTDGPDRRSRLLGHGLVAGQVALTLTVLAGAGLLVRSLARLQALEPGFATEQLYLAELTGPNAKYPDPADYWATLDRIVAGTEALPGVAAVAPVLTAPFPGDLAVEMSFTADGQTAEAAEGNPWLNYEFATEDLFEALGLEVVAGRPVTESDGADAEPVVVVNETLARMLRSDGTAVGKRIKWGSPDAPGPWRRVVGVVADVRYRTFREVRPSVYVPAEQGIPVKPGRLAVRAAAEPEAWSRPLRAAVANVDPDMDIVGVTRMTELMDGPLARPRFNAVLLGLLAALAVLLSAVGIYGTIAFYVGRRRREMGIRMALGASTADVRRLVLRQGALLGGVGVGLGLLGSIAAMRLLRSLLFEVSPTDPIALSAAGALLFAVALVAAAGPARRAGRADPARTLQVE